MSLPHLLQLDPFNIPNKVPYIKPEKKLATNTHLLKVGFIYQGSRTNMNDINRSIFWKEFANCFTGLSIEIHSLQIDSMVQQELELWNKLPKPKSLNKVKLLDHSQNIKNFSDTAAIIANLDIVIGVDSAAIHLSSAMAKPTFAFISNIHDWRWFRGINYSPWYLNLKLLRKPKSKGWDTCIQQMNQILKQMINN